MSWAPPSAVGLTSSTGALGSAGIGGVGSGAPALSAGMGQATSVGALTVPTAWTGAAPPVTAAGTAMHVGGSPAISAAPAGTQSAMPPMMPIANMGGRGGADDTDTIRASFDRDPLHAGRRIAARTAATGWRRTERQLNNS